MRSLEPGPVKYCNKCGLEKNRRDFSKAIKAKDGLQSNCKACKAAYYEKTRDPSKRRQKKYPPTREGFKQCHQCDEIKAVEKFCRDKNCKDGLKSVCRTCRLKWQRSTNGRYASHKSDCKKAGRTPLTLEQFASFTEDRVCAYCPNEAYGVDRIDSSIGYELWNCAPCCSMCNEMKLHYPLDDWKSQVKQIHDHLNLSGESPKLKAVKKAVNKKYHQYLPACQVRLPYLPNPERFSLKRI